MTTLVIPGPPVPKQRARVVNGHGFTPIRTRVYEQVVRDLARAVFREPFAGPVEVEIAFWLPDYKRRDLDNCIKAILDALNPRKGDPWGAWGDDSQIVRIVATKAVDRQYPRAVVEVRATAAIATKSPQSAQDAISDQTRPGAGPNAQTGKEAA